MLITKKQHDFFKLFDKFLKEMKNGKRAQKNGVKIRKSSIGPYTELRNSLFDFSIKKNFPMYITSLKHAKMREILAEEKRWNKFYEEYTNFLYDDCDCFDNYVGANIKKVRTFFNYLNHPKKMEVGTFHKNFFCHSEDIDIVVLIPEQLHFLIYSTEFEASLPDHLKRARELFVFGCTVALRLSDIFKLSHSNIETLNGKHYLKVLSQKTTKSTRILLPDYAVDIINKQPKNIKTIFPKISKARLNKNIKSLIERANWTGEVIKTRLKRGEPVLVYKNPKTKELYRFCDLIASHTMRRTAITTMLCLRMPENLVRQISGHAANSKEFFRYVELSQKYMDEESEKIYAQIKNKELLLA